jgi:hypothetical protein
MEGPAFIWGHVKALHYNHPAMERFYRGFALQHFVQAKQNPAGTILVRAFEFWRFFIGPILTIPIVILCGILPYGMSLRDLGRKNLFLVLLVLVTFVASLFPVYNEPHYAAPVTCAVYALLMQEVRRIRIWERHKGRGKVLARSVIVAAILSFAFSAANSRNTLQGTSLDDPLRLAMKLANTTRVQLTHSLTQHGQKFLIIVHYRPDHDGHEEWVYNAADIDNSRIVWAREMSPAADRELIDYFKDRQVLLLDADAHPPKLTPYSLQNSPEQLQLSAKETSN